jgi:hypothetical protein
MNSPPFVPPSNAFQTDKSNILAFAPADVNICAHMAKVIPPELCCAWMSNVVGILK